jgi:serine/threonine protein kinase
LGDTHPEIDTIFSTAIELDSTTERAAYIASACAGNERFRQRVEELIDAYFRAGDFLEPPTSDMPADSWTSSAETAGKTIGRYKLLEQIGEGGFGVVFMAEQEDPVRRRVALKIIKLGMDTKQVVARFEAERQALAMMDHPNIAKVLDGGATDAGRPYFVMELVRGEPITNYCDESRLTTNERLKLFVAVCLAVQHAHQKGIIHRDLKPSNILVTMHDDHPVPKIIDFGIAKATQARLTEKTFFTEFRQMIGTPAYMSPEQAQVSGIDIDTRSDIYSLGVLLYELLSGSTPFGSQELLSAGYAEMQRMIREVDPPPPSTRLLSSHDSMPSVAAQRRTEQAALAKSLRGDLDWIVMRCLEKDRMRRYETASSLAQDIERYLIDEPVEARRPTRLYRFRKFVRRNRIGVLAGSAIFGALLIGFIASSYFAASASSQAKRATAALAHAELNRKLAEGVNRFFTEEVFGLADPNRFDRAGISLVEALNIAAGKIDESFPDDLQLRAEIRDRFGEIYMGTDQGQKAVEQFQQAVELRRSLAGDKDPSTLKSRSNLGQAWYEAGRNLRAQAVMEPTLAEQIEVLGPGHPDTVHTASKLVTVLMEIHRSQKPGRQDDAELQIAKNSFQAALKNLGPHHEATLEIENSLAWALRWRNQPEAALEPAKDAMLGLRALKGDEDVRSMFATYNYAACLYDLGRKSDAAAEFGPLLALRYRVLGPAHTQTIYTAGRWADMLRHSSRPTESLAVLDEVYSHLGEIKARTGWSRARPLWNVMIYYADFGKLDRAAELESIIYEMYFRANSDDARESMYRQFADELAVLLAESPHPLLRDPDRAVALATKVCELTDYKDEAAVAVLAKAKAAAIGIVKNPGDTAKHP